MTHEPAKDPQGEAYSESALTVMLGQYAVMQAVVAATALVRNKVIALRLGPGAFGEVAQLGTVVAAVVSIVSFGMQVGLSRNVARAATMAERQALLANANGLVLLLSLIATVGVIAFLIAGNLLAIVGLPRTPEILAAALLFFATIPLIGLQTNLLSFLHGILDVRGLAVQRSLAVLLATVLCVPLVWAFGLVGAGATFFALNGLLALMFGRRCATLGYRWLAVRLDARILAALAVFGIVSMIGGFGQSLADTAIRASLLREYGSDANGIVQAPLVLALTVQAIVLGSIGSISLATMSRASTADETQSTIDRLLAVAVPISTASLGLLGLLGVPALVVLYSEAFAGGAALLPWILCAQLLQVAAWVVGAPLLAAGDRAIWLGLELVWSAVRWAVTLVLLPDHGPVAIGMGMLVAMAIHLTANLATLRLRYGVTIARRHVARAGFGLFLIGLVSIVGAYWTASIPAMAAGGAIWLTYATYVARTTPVLALVTSRLRARWQRFA